MSHFSTLNKSPKPNKGSSQRRLDNPARIGGTHSAVVSVPGKGSHLSLDTYMRLPTSQYYELDPNLIIPRGGNKFTLAVPRIQLFNVWLEPEVDVIVTLDLGHPNKTDPKVVIEAEDCRLKGSAWIQKMKLDEKFVLCFTTCLYWNAQSRPTEASVRGDLALDVFTEVLPPFDVLPRSLLEGTCNAVLGTLMSSLLPVFLKKLVQDYEKWATDETYRMKRMHIAQPCSESLPQQ